MKKIIIFIAALLSIFMLSSCGKNKNIEIAKEYVNEYYKNFSQKKSTQCFYQLNKNSVDSLEQKYSVDSESLISSRSSILGAVTGYEILKEEYFKESDDQYINFEILVKYENAEVNEKQQILIKKDGQTSINVLEFEDDGLISSFIKTYEEYLLSENFSIIKELLSKQYYESRTDRNLEDLFKDSSELGGKINSTDIISSKYIYEETSSGENVYEATLALQYDSAAMNNKIIISTEDGKFGISYLIILPEELLDFFENYTLYLSNEDMQSMMALYDEDVFDGDADKKDTKWRMLLTYSEAYGNIIDYEVQNFGVETIEEPDKESYEALRVDAIISYENKVVKHKFVLVKNENDEYLIKEEIILDE